MSLIRAKLQIQICDGTILIITVKQRQRISLQE